MVDLLKLMATTEQAETRVPLDCSLKIEAAPRPQQQNEGGEKSLSNTIKIAIKTIIIATTATIAEITTIDTKDATIKTITTIIITAIIKILPVRIEAREVNQMSMVTTSTVL
ncbi:MAG: hypothetical protein R2809_00800 [Flavobacteriales bacterium]